MCSVVTIARNRLVRMALAFDPPPTHILWVDSDMTFPPDSLVRLFKHDKDIVGAFYNRRTPPYTTTGILKDPLGSDVSKGGLHKAVVMPHGLVLVKKEVYEKLPSPWYKESFDPACASPDDPDGTVGEDVNFSRYVLEQGYDMWVDADLTFEVGHLGEIEVPCRRPEPPTAQFTYKDAA
jgi:hypothetical protein